MRCGKGTSRFEPPSLARCATRWQTRELVLRTSLPTLSSSLPQPLREARLFLWTKREARVRVCKAVGLTESSDDSYRVRCLPRREQVTIDPSHGARSQDRH